MNRKNSVGFVWRSGFLRALLLLTLLILPLPVHAASESQAAEQVKERTAVWILKKGKYYCRDGGKKNLKGLQTFGKKTYYMDSKGVQRTGWRKIDGKYYYFRQKNGAGGYRITSAVVNGVTLKKSGAAKTSSSAIRRKLAVMTECQEILDSLTKPSQKKAVKLSKAFEWVKSRTRRNIGGFRSGNSNWDLYYAERILSTGSGDCYCQGVLFAYMANAVGYSHVKAVSSGGHGWAEIGGKFYDPNWANVIGTKKCYGAAASQSGTGGRPSWKKNRRFIKDLGNQKVK